MTPGIAPRCAPFNDATSNAGAPASPSESSLVLLRDFVFREVAGSRFEAFFAGAVFVAFFESADFASPVCLSDFASASASQAFFLLDRLAALRLLSHSAEPWSPAISASERFVSTE